jgi:hypothetical protein
MLPSAGRGQIINGNFVHAIPTVSKMNCIHHNLDEEQFKIMCYTAVTCDPTRLVANGYRLYQKVKGREVDLAIAVVGVSTYLCTRIM